MATVSESLRQRLKALDSRSPDYAVALIDDLLATAIGLQASDIHLQPTASGLEVGWRIDGVLQPVGVFAVGELAAPITRLKVMADLLTYRMDIPQEGRIRKVEPGTELRVSSFPTLFGERAVVRILSAQDRPTYVDDLQLPDATSAQLQMLLAETSGMLVITGPAGSGKTTTAYACLRQIVADSRHGRSICSLEDPIEAVIPGVAQSQVHAAVGFTIAQGLRSLLRQDPEVILVGEVRDAETASIAFQAALTGQLVITTFHAGSAASAFSRFSDMGIEPYMLRGCIHGVLGQRLVRKLCGCARAAVDPHEQLGLDVQKAFVPVGCARCHGTGFRGRVPLAELLTSNHPQIAQAILNRVDAAAMESLAVRHGMQTRWQQAIVAVEGGLTAPSEIRRTLGFVDQPTGARQTETRLPHMS